MTRPRLLGRSTGLAADRAEAARVQRLRGDARYAAFREWLLTIPTSLVAIRRQRTKSESPCYPDRMSARLCTVTFQSPTGIRHGVDVHADSLYEAAALGLVALKKDGWIEGLGPSTRLEIQVREPATSHVISVDRLNRWVNGTTSSPVETLTKAKLRKLLGLAENK